MGDNADAAVVPAMRAAANNSLSIDEMQRELNEKFGLQIESNASLLETIDIYNTYISAPSNNRNIQLDLAEKRVKFPVLPTEILERENENMRKIGSFDFSDGGRFISDSETISDNDLPDIIMLLAAFITYGDDAYKINMQEKSDIGAYSHLPPILLHFAYHSRIDSGYRLLSRCARHVCDPKSHSMYEESATIF